MRSLNLILTADARAAANATARQIAEFVATKPNAILGLATGGTMEAVYARLIDYHRRGEVSFAQSRSFNLDEYVGLPPDHPRSYWRYMRGHLFDHVDFTEGATHLPRGDAADPEAEAAAFQLVYGKSENVQKNKKKLNKKTKAARPWPRGRGPRGPSSALVRA